MGRLNSPSDPHLSHGKRFYRPNKGGGRQDFEALCSVHVNWSQRTVLFAVANGAHCSKSYHVTAVHNQTAAKARSHAPTITASPLAIINSISRLRLLVPIHLRSCRRPLKGSSGLTKKAARLCTQSGAHFLLEATMGGMPPTNVPSRSRA